MPRDQKCIGKVSDGFAHFTKPIGRISWYVTFSLQWRHNGRDGVSNRHPHNCLLNCLFRRRSKKTLKLRVTGLCTGNSPTKNPPRKGSVTRKMFPFDDVIMLAILNEIKLTYHLTDDNDLIRYFFVPYVTYVQYFLGWGIYAVMTTRLIMLLPTCFDGGWSDNIIHIGRWAITIYHGAWIYNNVPVYCQLVLYT